MKNRKKLPNFGYLSNKTIDIVGLKNHLHLNGLLDPSIYNDIQYSANSKHQDFLVSNEYCKTNFFTENEATLLEGEKYKQLYLTDFDTSKKSNKVQLTKTNIFERTKRLNPNSDRYLPEADELNYGVRNNLVKGVLSNILDMFESKITRVRLAYLKANFSIKPHVDYDPSYIVRYHIPIITNENCKIHVIKNKITYSTNFIADGKIYFLNAGNLHWASNESNLDRLHLIIDVHGQTELDSLIPL